MLWEDIIQTYDRQAGTARICPVAHTKIIANIGIMLDEQSNILAAAKIKQSIFAPCTAASECRSRNVAPHLVHDNASYVANFNQKRHDAYMGQLKDYIVHSDDPFCKIVYRYLTKDTICKDLKHLIDLQENPHTTITFAIKNWDENTVNRQWADYHISTLPKNGICAITGKPDYIPKSYPGGIRYPGDMAKLFTAKEDKLDGMPQLRAGYIASQKIIHTLQSMFNVWSEQGEIPLENIVIRRSSG